MPTPKLQALRALTVYPTNNALIPFPGNLKTTGTNTSTTAFQLICSTGNFIVNNIQVGDIIFNSSDFTYATVTQVISATTLQLNGDIFTATAKGFTIYGSPAPNAGCALYIGTAGNLNVLTAGDDIVTFYNIPAGTFLPVLVKQVYGATLASGIVALW